MPSSNNSSAICGVMPNPPAAFSPFATVNSTPCSFCSSGSRSWTMVRPGRPKMSPTKRMRTTKKTPQNPMNYREIRCYHALTRLLGDLRRAQKVVISRRIDLNPSHSLGMHQHIIQIPQIDVRQLIRNDLLHLGVNRLALLLIERRSSLANQRVHSRVRIECPVRPLRRKALRVEHILEDVRVL